MSNAWRRLKANPDTPRQEKKPQQFTHHEVRPSVRPPVDCRSLELQLYACNRAFMRIICAFKVDSELCAKYLPLLTTFFKETKK